MPDKHILAALAIGILAFGLSISGCNRDSRTASRSTRGLAREGAVRPAEVLAVSVYRPASIPVVARQYPAPAEPAPAIASAAALAEPVPAWSAAPAPFYAGAPVQSAPPPSPLAGLVQPAPDSAAFRPLPLIQPTPDLAIAKADLPPGKPAASVPVTYIHPIVPIPELSPDLYRSAKANFQPSRQPTAITMISGQTSPDRLEIQRALAPLAEHPIQPAPAPRIAVLGNKGQDWIASPAMAMRANF